MDLYHIVMTALITVEACGLGALALMPRRARGVWAPRLCALTLAVCWGGLCVGPHGARVAWAATRPPATPRPPAAPRPSPTPLGRIGTLTLSASHVTPGTSSVGAIVAGFVSGESIHFTWSLGDGATHEDIGDTKADSLGAGQATLALPQDAPPGTYNVVAQGDLRTQAAAFLTVDPPGATPAPTARPALSPVIQFLPPDFTRGISATDANGVSVRVVVDGFEPHQHITIALALLKGSPRPAAVTLGVLGPTDASGHAAADLALPDTLLAGPYDAEASQENGAAAGHASASWTLRDSAGLASQTSSNPVDLCGLFNICQNMQNAMRAVLLGTVAAANNITDNGRTGVVEGVMNTLFYQPDYTDKSFDPLKQPMRIFFALVYTLIKLALIVVLGNIILDLFANKQIGRGLLLLAFGGGLVYWAVDNCLTLESGAWGEVRRVVGALDAGTAKPIDAALNKYLRMDPKTLTDKVAFDLGAVMILLMGIMLLPVFIFLVLSKFLIIGAQVLLFVIGVLYIVLLFPRQTREQGLWWVRGMAALTLVAPLYAALASIGVAVVGIVLATGGTNFSLDFIAAGAAFAIGVLLMGAPQIAPRLVSFIGRGGRSAADDVAAGSMALRGGIQRRARAMLPF